MTKTSTRQLRGNWTDNPCWYVSVQDAGRNALVLGPFRDESECRQYAYGGESDEPGGDTRKHYDLIMLAESRDPKAWFYAWGMVKMANGYRNGTLNGLVRTDGLWTGTLRGTIN